MAILQPSCDRAFAGNWSLVPGATAAEQWPVEFAPKTGWQPGIDDTAAVTRSNVGLYTFIQPISIYGATETFTFQVQARTDDKRRIDPDSSYERLRAFLDPRGTVHPIKGRFPGTNVTKWVQKNPPQYTHQGGGLYEASIVLEQDHTPG